jgi:hypothetical protein
MTLLRGIVLIAIALVFCSGQTCAQDTLRITTADKSYFKPLNVEGVYYHQLKDSLPDGVYLVCRDANSRVSRKCNHPIITATYVNGVKDGKYSDLSYQIRKRHCKPRTVRETDYKGGKKHGLELSYSVQSEGTSAIMISQGEYKEGNRHGVFIEYNRGVPLKTEYYEDGELVHSLYTPETRLKN